MGRVWVVVVAAGSGRRFGAAKQYEPLAGRRVLDWSLDAARSVVAGPGVAPGSDPPGGVVLVVAPGHEHDDEPAADAVVAGAGTRSGSVRAGLARVPDDAEVIVVHDGARPLADAALFAAVVGAVRAGADAVVPGVPVADTLRSRGGGVVDRDGLVAVQTPQAFRAAALRAAHAEQAEATDDASLVEAGGGKVVVVDGSPTNLKITRQADLVVAEALLRAR
jgi:2-C-methyl-D-erythritol 4-phosphate cytidylyltransferase